MPSVVRRRFLLALLGPALAALGCGGAPPAASTTPLLFPDEAAAILTSPQARLVVAVRTAPEQPPTRGIDAIQFRITDAAGQPATGLTVQLVPWMPAHGHGASVHPTVIDRGDGVYEAQNVVLFMEGHWELRTTLIQGDTRDAVTPTFDVR